MAALRAKDAKAMDSKARAEKLKELRMELVKSVTGANKAAAKTKEIKKAIARILTFEAAGATKPQKVSKHT